MKISLNQLVVNAFKGKILKSLEFRKNGERAYDISGRKIDSYPLGEMIIDCYIIQNGEDAGICLIFENVRIFVYDCEDVEVE